MAADIPVIDVWTQYIKGTPPGVNPIGENVFRNYGMLDVFHEGTNVERMVAAMDAAGVQVALMAGDNEQVAAAQEKYPGRIYGQYHADPTNIMDAVRGLDHYVRQRGFVCLRIEPFMWKKAPTDRMYYPLYAKAVELDVTFQTQVGHTGPPPGGPCRPSWRATSRSRGSTTLEGCKDCRAACRTSAWT
jgi:predicted TIM-barrel fold metal-dependent hydrolase